MTTTTTTTTTILPNKLVVSTTGRSISGVVLSAEQALANGLDVPAGMFAVNLRSDVVSPYFVFGKLTGRTRKMWGGIVAPTLNLFACDTVARETGNSFALWGVPGVQMRGTWATRPENVS